MVSNIIGSECFNFVEVVFNVFVCSGFNDGVVIFILFVDFVLIIIKRFSFGGNWILDLIRLKGSFLYIAFI